eukprot:ctg_1347.g440
MTLVTRDRLQWLAALTVLFAFATIFSLSTCSTTWGWAWQRWRDRYVGGGLASTELPPLPPGAARQMQALLEYAKDGQVRAANGTVMDRPARHLFHSSVNDIFEWRVFWLLDPSACHHWDGAAASGRSLLRNVAKRVKRTAIYLRFKPEMSVKVPHDPETRSDVYMNLHDAENGLKVRGVSRGSSDESPYVELKVRVRTHVFRNPLLTQPIVIEVWDKTLHQAVAAAQVGNLSEWRRILREHVEHIQSHDGESRGTRPAASRCARTTGVAAQAALPSRDATGGASAHRRVQVGGDRCQVRQVSRRVAIAVEHRAPTLLLPFDGDRGHQRGGGGHLCHGRVRLGAAAASPVGGGGRLPGLCGGAIGGIAVRGREDAEDVWRVDGIPG